MLQCKKNQKKKKKKKKKKRDEDGGTDGRWTDRHQLTVSDHKSLLSTSCSGELNSDVQKLDCV